MFRPKPHDGGSSHHTRAAKTAVPCVDFKTPAAINGCVSEQIKHEANRLRCHATPWQRRATLFYLFFNCLSHLSSSLCLPFSFSLSLPRRNSDSGSLDSFITTSALQTKHSDLLQRKHAHNSFARPTAPPTSPDCDGYLLGALVRQHRGLNT